MSLGVNLGKAYQECLPTELGDYFTKESPDHEYPRMIHLSGNAWEVFADAKPDGSSFFTRAISQEGTLHIWNCVKDPNEEDQILVNAFEGTKSFQYAIPYDQKNELYARIFLEGEQADYATLNPIAESVAQVAMRWIEEQGLQEHCKDLIGWEFSKPVVNSVPPIEIESTSDASSDVTQENPTPSYAHLFVKFVLVVAVIYLVCTVASCCFGQAEIPPFPETVFIQS